MRSAVNGYNLFFTPHLRLGLCWRNREECSQINAKWGMSAPKETSGLNRPMHMSVLLVLAALLVSVFAASATAAEAPAFVRRESGL